MIRLLVLGRLLRRRHGRGKRAGWWVVAALAGLAPATSGFAGADGQVRLAVSIGIAGRYVPSHWNAATVTIPDPGRRVEGDLRIEVRPSDLLGQEQRQPSFTYEVPVVAESGRTVVHLALLLPSEPHSATVTLTGEGGTVATTHLDLAEAESQASTLSLLIAARPDVLRRTMDVPAETVVIAPDDVPEDARGLDAVHCVAIYDLRLEDLPERTWRSLEGWAACGGTLVLGAPCLATSAGSGRLREVAGAIRIGARGPMSPTVVGDVFGGGAGRVIASASGLACQAPPEDVLVAAEGKPLAFEELYGSGTIRGLATDPSWMGFADLATALQFSRSFWAKATSCRKTEAFSTFTRRGGVPDSLVPDEGRFSHVGRPMQVFLVIYLLVMGPACLLVLARLRRRELMLVTAPAVVVVFLGVAAVIGVALHPRSPLLEYQTIDVSAARTGGAGVFALAGVYAPTTAAYPLLYKSADPLARSFDVGEWDSPNPTSAYAAEGGMAFAGAPVKRWSMVAALTTSGRTGHAVVGSLRLGEKGLSGEVENRLPFPLEDCYLVHKWNHVAVGYLPPGERRTVSLGLGPPKAREATMVSLGSLGSLRGWLDPELWPERAYDRRMGLALVAAENASISHPSPILIGWGKGLVDGPGLWHETGYRNGEEHLYIVQLPLAPEGRDIVVPVGGAPSVNGGGWSNWLLVPAGQDERRWRPTGPDKDFLLPIGGGQVRHLELKVRGHLDFWSEKEATVKPRLELVDWRAGAWVTVAEKVGKDFACPVPDPGRFILSPRGLVRARLYCDEYYYLDLAWMDLEYRGQAVTR